MYAKVLDGDILAGFSNNKDSYFESDRVIEVPEFWINLGFKSLKLTGDLVTPIDDEEFNGFLMQRLINSRDQYLELGTVMYKDHYFSLSHKNKTNLLHKALILGNQGGKKSATIVFKSKVGYLKMNHQDISEILKLMDTVENGLIENESKTLEAIRNAKSYEERVDLAVFKF